MSDDQVTKVTTQGYGQRLLSAVGGIFFGIILFFGSFALLFWNEGRADMSKVAENAVEISAEQVDPSLNGKLVAVSGTVVADKQIGDTFLQPGAYLSLQRNVEMYSWKEKAESKMETKLGGSEQTTTTYSYVKEWQSTPDDSSTFHNKGGRENPPMAFEAKTIQTASATIGAFSIPAVRSIALPGREDLPLTDANIILPATGSGETMTGSTMTGVLMGGYMFIGKGTLTTPEIGDLRISYQAVYDNQQVTVLAKQNGSELVEYKEQGKGTLYSMNQGTLADAVESLANSHAMTIWGFRIGGFFMMWIGLSSVLAPINVLLDILPFLGSLSRGVTGFVTGVVAFVLSVLTIILSMLLHNIIILLLLAVAGIAITIFILKRKAPQKA